jgi:hypothetical protein
MDLCDNQVLCDHQPLPHSINARYALAPHALGVLFQGCMAYFLPLQGVVQHRPQRKN